MGSVDESTSLPDDWFKWLVFADAGTSELAGRRIASQIAGVGRLEYPYAATWTAPHCSLFYALYQFYHPDSKRHSSTAMLGDKIAAFLVQMTRFSISLEKLLQKPLELFSVLIYSIHVSSIVARYLRPR